MNAGTIAVRDDMIVGVNTGGTLAIDITSGPGTGARAGAPGMFVNLGTLAGSPPRHADDSCRLGG